MDSNVATLLDLRSTKVHIKSTLYIIHLFPHIDLNLSGVFLFSPYSFKEEWNHRETM